MNVERWAGIGLVLLVAAGLTGCGTGAVTRSLVGSTPSAAVYVDYVAIGSSVSVRLRVARTALPGRVVATTSSATTTIRAGALAVHVGSGARRVTLEGSAQGARLRLVARGPGIGAMRVRHGTKAQYATAVSRLDDLERRARSGASGLAQKRSALSRAASALGSDAGALSSSLSSASADAAAARAAIASAQGTAHPACGPVTAARRGAENVAHDAQFAAGFVDGLSRTIAGVVAMASALRTDDAAVRRDVRDARSAVHLIAAAKVDRTITSAGAQAAATASAANGIVARVNADVRSVYSALDSLIARSGCGRRVSVPAPLATIAT